MFVKKVLMIVLVSVIYLINLNYICLFDYLFISS